MGADDVKHTFSCRGGHAPCDCVAMAERMKTLDGAEQVGEIIAAALDDRGYASPNTTWLGMIAMDAVKAVTSERSALLSKKLPTDAKGDSR